MSAISKFWKRINRTTLYSAKNPENFNEKWGIKTTPFRMFSLILVLFVLLLFIGAFFVAPLFDGQVADNSALKKQVDRISVLESKLAVQEQYISDIKTVLSGGHVGLIENDTIVNMSSLNVDSIDNSVSDYEKALADEVENDMTYTEKVRSTSLVYFSSPIEGGLVSQKFSKNHQAIDVVAKANTPFKSCLDGTVIYTGYSVNDGNIIIVKHPNDFISVYKHAKTIFKKVGDKVDLGDPLGIIGESGEDSTGPHLHFELWQGEKVMNPETFVKFEF